MHLSERFMITSGSERIALSTDMSSFEWFVGPVLRCFLKELMIFCLSDQSDRSVVVYDINSIDSRVKWGKVSHLFLGFVEEKHEN